MPSRAETGRAAAYVAAGFTMLITTAATSGCGHVLPVSATFQGSVNANVSDAVVRGGVEVKLPSAVDPGEMTSTVVRTGQTPGACAGCACRRRRALVQSELRRSLLRG